MNPEITNDIEEEKDWISNICLPAKVSFHPMSWLAVTFTTQEINSLRPKTIYFSFACNLFSSLAFGSNIRD